MGIVCTTYALCGMMDVMVGGLRGIGYSIMPMLVSLVGACGLRRCGSPPFSAAPVPHHPDDLLVLSHQLGYYLRRPRDLFPVGHEKVKRQLLPEGAPAPVEVPPLWKRRPFPNKKKAAGIRWIPAAFPFTALAVA